MESKTRETRRDEEGGKEGRGEKTPPRPASRAPLRRRSWKLKPAQDFEIEREDERADEWGEIGDGAAVERDMAVSRGRSRSFFVVTAFLVLVPLHRFTTDGGAL